MMLDVMRKHSRSFIIYIFFAIIIAVFVVNFGPQSAGCTTKATSAGDIAGRRLSPVMFKYIMTASGIRERFSSLPEHLMVSVRARVMDQLLARDLLAEDARAMGFAVPDKEINDMIVKGRFMVLGRPSPLILGEDGKFDYHRFSRYVRFRWQMTVQQFKEEQEQELLAQKMRQLLRTSTKASEAEVKADYTHSNTKVTLEYVRITGTDVKDKVRITKDKVAAYLKAHKKEVEDYFKANKSAYEKLPKQVRLRVLKVAFGDDKDAARSRAESLLSQIKGGKDFAPLARAESDDETSKNAGGLISWRNEDSPGVGEAADKAVGKVKTGEISDIIEEKDAFFLAKVEGRRQGDLKLADVQDEIAEELYRNTAAVDAAKEEAVTYLARIKAGAKLADLFTTDEDELLGDDKADGDEKKADEEKADGDEKKADGDEKKADEEKADGDEKKADGDEKKADGDEKKADGDEKKADGDEKKADSDEEKADEEKADEEKADEEAKPDKPKKSPLKLVVGNEFSRSPQYLVPGIGISKEITEAVFKLKQGQVADKPFTVGQMVYIVGVKDRTEADMGEWTKRKSELTEQYLDEKASEMLRDVMLDRCKQALESGRISINKGILVTPGYTPQKGDQPLPQYVPCSSLEAQTGAGAGM